MYVCKNLRGKTWGKKIVSLMLISIMINSLFATMVYAEDDYYIISFRDSCVRKIDWYGDELESIKIEWENANRTIKNIKTYTQFGDGDKELSVMGVELLECIEDTTNKEKHKVAMHFARLLKTKKVTMYVDSVEDLKKISLWLSNYK